MTTSQRRDHKRGNLVRKRRILRLAKTHPNSRHYYAGLKVGQGDERKAFQ